MEMVERIKKNNREKKMTLKKKENRKKRWIFRTIAGQSSQNSEKRTLSEKNRTFKTKY